MAGPGRCLGTSRLRRVERLAESQPVGSRQGSVVLLLFRTGSRTMADGERYLARDWTYGEARLGWATQARSSLWARCRCGREAVVDPSAWIAQGLSRQILQDLEGRLRCVCGARRARL